jgi:hypothetical protein
MTFTVEEIDYLDSRGDAEARRSRHDKGNPPPPAKGQSAQSRPSHASSRVSA